MAFIRPAGVQNYSFSLGDVGAYLGLNQGPLNGNGQVQISMADVYNAIDTNNLSGTPPLPSTTTNLTIQWFFGRDVNGVTNYSSYYKSNISNGSANTFNYGIYGNQCPSDRLSWGIPNVGTTRDFHGHLLSVNTTTGVRYYASACCTNGWRPGVTIYTISGSSLQSSNCLSLLANGNILDSIPVGGALGAAWSPVLNTTSGYGMVATTDDGGYYNLRVSMYYWQNNYITPTNSNVTSVSNGFPVLDNAFVNPEDALYMGNQASDYDVVAILVNRQWQGNMVIFIKRNGGSISSMATQTLMSPGQYQDYVVQSDNMQAALAWDNINNKMYSFYLYWGDPGPYNSGAVIAKFDVNLNGTGTVSTSNMTTWKMWDAFQNPGMRSAGCTIIYNDGMNNYIAVVWNHLNTGTGQWSVYMRIFTNDPGTNTYNLLNNTTYTVFGPGTLFNNGGERIHVERMADTQIVNSAGVVTSNLTNFMVSYVSDDSNTVICWYQLNPNNSSITLMDTTTLSSNYRGLLSHNYSALTGQYFNSSLVVSSPAVGGTPRDTYPWNGNKVYNYQGISDNSTMIKIT